MRRAAIALVVLGFVVVTAVWWLFFISPKNAAIGEAGDALDAAQSEEQRLRTTIAGLREIKDSEVGFLVAISDMETSIPTNPELDTFIEDLTFLVDSTGVDLATITSSIPTLSTTAPGLFEIDLNLAVQGQYFEVLGFLYGLESMDRLVRVDLVQLSPGAAAEEEETGTGDTGTEDEGTSDGTSDGTDDTADATDEEARPRADTFELSVTLNAKIFTRTEVVAPVTEEGEGS